MSKHYPSGKPANYDKSIDRLTPDWKGGMGNPDPSLSTVKYHGDAVGDVMGTASKVLGGRSSQSQVQGGTKAHQTNLHSNPYHMPSGAGSFANSQIPNTSPKFGNIASKKVENVKRPEKSKSNIFHGDPSQKGL